MLYFFIIIFYVRQVLIFRGGAVLNLLETTPPGFSVPP